MYLSNNNENYKTNVCGSNYTKVTQCNLKAQNITVWTYTRSCSCNYRFIYYSSPEVFAVFLENLSKTNINIIINQD